MTTNTFAPLAERNDWAHPDVARAGEDLTPALREELGAYWAELGQTAHAAVAVFARFTLQLLALGAPSELVAEAQAATGDELEHARLCFGLASALSGRPIGPGPLSLGAEPEGGSIAEAVRLAVIEGCVGQTLAALEAAEALTRASVPAACTILTKVCDDGKRHADLAWRFVRWSIESGSEGGYEAAAEAFVRAFDQVEASDEAGDEAGDPGDSEQAQAFGRLSGPLRAALRRRALSEVLGPCAEELLANAITSLSTPRPKFDARAA
jgi:hypothetical protein